MTKSKKIHTLATYFDSNILLLKLTAFWIYDDETTTSKKYLQHAYNIFWFFFLFVAYQPAELLYVYYSFNDLSVFLRALRDIGNHVSLAYKAFNYFIMRKDILQLMDTLQHGNYHYEDYKNFQPKLIVNEEKKQALKWTKYFLSFCNVLCGTLFANGLFTFLFMSDTQYVEKNGQRVYQQEQPVNTVSPFGSGTKLQFFITFIYTIIALTFYAWMIVALDSLFITIMSCISGHLKILQGAFKTIRARCIMRTKMEKLLKEETLHDPPFLEDCVDKEMVHCIKHLQIVLSVSEKLESIYSTQTFIQTFISLGEMCFSLYLLSETADQNMGNEITYLIATGFELLLYCWFGNRITEASLKISYALYESEWLPTSSSCKKQIIFTMTRMQRPINITIGKITPLTFSTFLTMARGAYSFFTFLKQRHGRNH
ncbi:putative odorant receptor 92a [Tribolium madens]|uniref:putative odorant receptor 92a n=1 Tax=Tribolium madens TaxID=41895 RepID=UPI001CF76492|nr:putative odorant receptor 92a [Tribolium madens]